MKFRTLNELVLYLDSMHLYIIFYEAADQEVFPIYPFDTRLEKKTLIVRSPHKPEEMPAVIQMYRRYLTLTTDFTQSVSVIRHKTELMRLLTLEFKVAIHISEDLDYQQQIPPTQFPITLSEQRYLSGFFYATSYAITIRVGPIPYEEYVNISSSIEKLSSIVQEYLGDLYHCKLYILIIRSSLPSFTLGNYAIMGANHFSISLTE